MDTCFPRLEPLSNKLSIFTIDLLPVASGRERESLEQTLNSYNIQTVFIVIYGL